MWISDLYPQSGMCLQSMGSFTAFVTGHWLHLAGICASILLAALFAASETAIVFSNKSYLRQLADTGSENANAALSLLDKRVLLHSTLLLAEIFFIVLSTVLGTMMAADMLSSPFPATILTSVLLTFIVVFFAKLAPKSLACKKPDQFALVIAPFLNRVMKLLSPVSRLLTGTADVLVGPGPQGMSCAAVITEEDIKAMINLGEERGSLKEEEKELLHKVFEFGDTLASQAMRPRTEIVSVSSKIILRDVFSLISEFGYSRYPVIDATVDTVIGILYIKDILVAMSAGEVSRESGIQQFIRPAYFIPENKRVSELLAEMQRKRFQIAIVIDEYGGTSGLVTLEDLIEEIVGSIHDELESEDRDVQIVDEKNIVISGQSAFDEVNELLGTNLESKDFNTLGGLLFGLFGHMPKVGEQLKYKNLKFEVLDCDGRKITKIKITKL
jgi:CBS domain containing-hemolysin-like protein